MEFYTKDWVAYCTKCNKVIEHCANGTWVEAAARVHTRDTLMAGDAHLVLVGNFNASHVAMLGLDQPVDNDLPDCLGDA